MSYDIRLICPVTRQTLHSETTHNMTGGTYVMGGTTELWLNITYNYSSIFHKVLGESGIRSLYGKSGAEAIPVLKLAINQLNDDVDPDYWKATEGNAKKSLYGLLALAQIRPDGIFDGD